MIELVGKTLLFVGGGHEALEGIKKAQKLGIFTVVSDINPEAPALVAADAGIVASTYDVAATVAAAWDFHQKVRPIDGVMCIATDVPLTVASVAEKLRLPGISVEVAARAMDKLAMKEKFLADGVNIPWFSATENIAALHKVVEQRGLPLVIKPVDSRGGRGVQRLLSEIDLTAAFEESKRHSPSQRVMVEEYLGGLQISTESIVLDGIAYTSGFADRNYEFLDRFAPHFIENGGQQPTTLSLQMKADVESLVQKAALSLGVRNGVVKGDIVVSNGKPYIIEMAARLSGGYFCTHQIPLGTGVDLVKAMIKLSLGLPVDPLELKVQFQRGVCARYLFSSPGRVRSVSGVPEAASSPGVKLAEAIVKEGDIVSHPVDSNAASALVLAVGKSSADAKNKALSALSKIQIVTEPI